MTTWSEESPAPPLEFDDLALDLRIAIANARMEVYHAHRMTASAGVWHEVLAALLDARTSRRQLREAVDDAMYPYGRPDSGRVRRRVENRKLTPASSILQATIEDGSRRTPMPPGR
jgi:hypothetical protein